MALDTRVQVTLFSLSGCWEFLGEWPLLFLAGHFLVERCVSCSCSVMLLR